VQCRCSAVGMFHRGGSFGSAALWCRKVGCRFEWRRREGKRSIPGAKVTARRMDLPLRAVARALDLPIATRPARTRWLSCDQLDVIEAATGVSSSVVEALTLSVYDGTALQLDPNSHRLDATFPSTTPSERSPPRTVRTNLAEVGNELFTSTGILGKMAVEKMLAGLSTRRHPVGLGPVGEQVAEKSSATSQSAVSRRFVAMTETALAELLSQDLSGLDLVALMIDGLQFAESRCVVALGIGIDGVKHPLALVEGSTENATLVTDLLVGLRGRGLDVTRPMLVGIDGSKVPAQGRGQRARSPGDPALGMTWPSGQG
jgi:hypothetical protein